MLAAICGMLLGDACDCYMLFFSNTFVCSLFSYLLHSVNGLLKAAGQSTFTPKKGSKAYGTISVDQCKITGAESSSSATVIPTSTEVDISVVPVPVQQFDNMNLGAMPVPVPPPRKPTFVDYITGNCDLNMVRICVLLVGRLHRIFPLY